MFLGDLEGVGTLSHTIRVKKSLQSQWTMVDKKGVYFLLVIYKVNIFPKNPAIYFDFTSAKCTFSVK